MIVLGIESSHDDTSLAIVKNNKVLSFLKISQIEKHKQYGGTVPEIASREHYDNFYLLLEQLKKEFDLSQIDLIAYTKQPGLIGALQMGEIFAHALAKSLNKKLIPINHLEGHIYSVLLDQDVKISYPSLALVVSGGHTNLYLLKKENDLELIGSTLDDALGEVFDKISRVIYNEFPGGPKIDQVFSQLENENIEYIKLTKPKTEQEFDFSYSGYKTSIINILKKNLDIDRNILAASFQKSAIDFTIDKVKLAIEKFQPKSIILSGGVSANQYLRKEFQSLHKKALIPILKYSTDNGAMIAMTANIMEKSKK